MDTDQTLLLFHLDKIREDAHWDAKLVDRPRNCSALVVSGGICDFQAQVAKWSQITDLSSRLLKPAELGSAPFLSEAPAWVIDRVIWSLLGPVGRLYPVFEASDYVLKSLGLEPGPSVIYQALVTLSLQTQQQAESTPWQEPFFTCFSDGLALGFWSDVTRLEKKLQLDPITSPLIIPGKSVYTMDDRKQLRKQAHPYLYECWEQFRFEWLLENVPMVIRPWGWEDAFDLIFLSTRMAGDEMTAAIRRELGRSMTILEYDNDAYDTWLREIRLP